MKLTIKLIALSFIIATQAFAFKISRVKVEGNRKVESRAILKLMQSQPGTPMSKEVVAQDIRTLFDLGVFTNINVYSSGTTLIVAVSEKPSVVEIAFSGFNEVSEADVEKKISTERYRVVDTAVLASDVRLIEEEYAKKGFFLAKVKYELEEIEKGKVRLKFFVREGKKVQVGSIEIHGNQSFSDGQIMEGFLSRPVTRMSKLSPRAIFQDAIVQRDNEFISLFYKNKGYAKVQTGKPSVTLDASKDFVHVTYNVEEGKQYRIGKIGYSGASLLSSEELEDARELNTGDVFNYSKFSKDIEKIVDEYGNLGFAFADVAPIPDFNDEEQTVDLDIRISKGRKVYIGEISITGNTKTRDNVIRRELQFSEGELYQGTRLTKAKADIERLGFFEQVQVIREKSEKRNDSLDLKIRVKEKPTGQLQAALGFTPSNNTSESRFFGQGRYEEKNQSGKGWKTAIAGRWNRGDNFSISGELYEPRFKDSDWSLGGKVFLDSEVKPLLGTPFVGVQAAVSTEVDVTEKRVGGSITVGRKVVEKVRSALTYRIEDVETDSPFNLGEQFLKQGLSSSLTLSFSRNATNNFIDPSSGSNITLSQKVSGSILGGIDDFGETALDIDYYFPIDFAENYRTYFRFHSNFSFVYKTSSSQVPFYERYRLGGFNDLRGFPFQSLGPTEQLVLESGEDAVPYNRGGNKKMVYTLEYYFPLIPEAGLKAVLFGDVGQAFDDGSGLSFDNLEKDIGFGFRWITPIAPFRFEWAYPWVDGKLSSKPEFIFFLGY